MSSNSSETQVRRILARFYVMVVTLEEAVHILNEVIGATCMSAQDDNSLIRPGDKDSYVNLMKNTLVATPATARRPSCDLVDSPNMGMGDLIVTLTERIYKRDKNKNTLTLGYQEISEHSTAFMRLGRSVEPVHPSYSINMFRATHWHTLLDRIGNARLVYLLLNRAVFVALGHSNYIQVTGIPIYEMWPVQEKVAKVARPGDNVVQQRRVRRSKIAAERRKRWRRKVARETSNGVTKHNYVTSDNVVTVDSTVTSGNIVTVDNTVTSGNIVSVDNTVTSGNIVSVDNTVTSGNIVTVDNTVTSGIIATIDNTVTSGDIATIDNTVTSGDIVTIENTLTSGNIVTVDNTVTSGNTVTVDNTVTSGNTVTVDNTVTSDNIVTIDNTVTNASCETDGIDMNENSVVECDTSVTSRMLTDDTVSSDARQHDMVTVSHDTDVSRLSRKRPCEVLGEMGNGQGGGMGERDTIQPRKKRKEEEETQPGKRRRRRRRKKVKASGTELGKAYSFHLAFDRRRIFYIRDLQEKFPGNHILSKVTADDTGVMSLLDCVFVKTDVGAVVTQDAEGSQPQALSDVHKALMPHLKLLISNHKQCRYHRLLQNFAPLRQMQQPHITMTTAESRVAMTTAESHVATTIAEPQVGKGSDTETLASAPQPQDTSRRKKTRSRTQWLETQDTRTLLELYTSTRQVFLFLRAVCDRVIPSALWGSARNKHIFLNNVHQFLELGKFERLTLGQVMKKIKVTECSWLDSVWSHLRRQELTAKFLYWMVNDYVMVLLKSFFYITDSTSGKNHVFHYRKTLWRVIKQKALGALLRKGTLSCIDKKTLDSLLGKEASMGVSYLRFLPKAASLRSIISMSRRLSPITPKKFKCSINFFLKDLLHVLRFETEEDPSLLGSSVFGISDIYKKWKTFVLQRRARNDSRCLYCVKVDIETCYDTVDGHRLFSLISDIFNKRKNGYMIRHYVTVREVGGKLKRTFHSQTVKVEDFEVNLPFMLWGSGHILKKNIHDTIFCSKVKLYICKKEELLKMLKAHLFANIVTFDGAYYLQTQGITQGSVLSTLLNNVYYGDLEKRHLVAPQDDELLMRHTDDFLFVTPYLDRATSFLDTLLPGIPEYNCRVNTEKTLCNFRYNGTTALPPAALFPWCGLLIDPRSLEVRPDYSRSLAQAVTDSVTTELSHNPGTAMKEKLLYCLKIKCHALFLDPQINSTHVARTNVYTVFLHLAAMFQCIVHKFPSNQSVQTNPTFFLGVVQQLSQTLLRLCKKHSQTDDDRDALSKTVISWLCCTAFEQKLQQRQSAYRSLLKLLRRWRSQLEKHMDSTLKDDITQITKNAGITEAFTKMLD